MNKAQVLKHLNTIEASGEQNEALQLAIKTIDKLHVRDCIVCGTTFTTNSTRKYCDLKCKEKIRYNVYE